MISENKMSVDIKYIQRFGLARTMQKNPLPSQLSCFFDVLQLAFYQMLKLPFYILALHFLNMTEKFLNSGLLRFLFSHISIIVLFKRLLYDEKSYLAVVKSKN